MSPLLRGSMKVNSVIKNFEDSLTHTVNESGLPISIIRITLELVLNKVMKLESDRLMEESIAEMNENKAEEAERDGENGEY